MKNKNNKNEQNEPNLRNELRQNMKGSFLSGNSTTQISEFDDKSRSVLNEK